MPTFAAAELRPFATRLLAAVRASPEEAETIADVLVSANLAGHDSHGVIRIEQYARMVRQGQVVPGAPFEILRRSPPSALVDGNWGFGAVVATRVTCLGIEMAQSTGVAVVSVRRCNHVSRLG